MKWVYYENLYTYSPLIGPMSVKCFYQYSRLGAKSMLILKMFKILILNLLTKKWVNFSYYLAMNNHYLAMGG